MNNPKISVVMTVYNEEKYISETITSVLNQTFQDFELVIIDDNSDDATYAILENICDERIKIHKNQENLGCAKSSNIGLQLARGEYIARIDGDDTWYPEKLDRQYDFLLKNPDIAILGTGNEVIDENGETIDNWDSTISPEAAYFLLNFRNCLTHSTVMYKKAFALENGGYNEAVKWALDYDFFHRASKIGRICVMGQILAKWRYLPIKSECKITGQKETLYKIVSQNLRSLGRYDIDETSIDILNNLNSIAGRNYSKPEVENALYHFLIIRPRIIQKTPEFLSKIRVRMFSIGFLILLMTKTILNYGMIPVISSGMKYYRNYSNNRF